MTAHGGTIVVGFPTVALGGMPAARQMDMHVCPMLNPGVPPPPHVGGPISMGSAGVFIGGMPAARVGDMATCSGPPDTIAMGCFTVLIGEVGSPSGAGGGAAAAASASASSATSRKGHWIEYKFVDSACLPITGLLHELEGADGKREKGVLAGDGRLRRDGLQQAGSCTARIFAITGARWSKSEADAEETLTTSANVIGFEDGTSARVTVFDRDITGAVRQIETAKTETSGGKVKAEWTFPYPEEEEPRGAGTHWGYSRPGYFFEVHVGNLSARSDFLRLKDWIAIELKDENGNPMAGEAYVVYLPDGSVREGNLDRQGRAREENVSPIAARITFPNMGETRQLPGSSGS